MGSALQRVVRFWDEHVAAWAGGEDPMPAPLPEWFASYQGTGIGAVTRDGFPEPYAGDVLASPRMVVLGLNPGRYQPTFQARDGTFAGEIREFGSYSAWTATTPYLRAPWTQAMGPNRYYEARVGFMRRWLNDPEASPGGLVIFEAYPWHSTAVTAAMRPPPDVIDEFVWRPIADLPVSDGSAVASRAIRVYEISSGQRLVVEWHSGSASPPSSEETALLRRAVRDV